MLFHREKVYAAAATAGKGQHGAELVFLQLLTFSGMWYSYVKDSI